MASRPHTITKSLFLAARQCLRRAWWEHHEPSAPELRPDAAERWLFEQGKAAGLAARAFAPGAAYEVPFASGDLYARADIVETAADGTLTLVEVKATTSLKPEQIADVALQWHVARLAGAPVTRVHVMHLNDACHHPDLGNLFVRVDVTAEATALLPAIPQLLDELRTALDGPRYEIDVGDHCFKPDLCAFLDRCWPRGPGHVSELYRIGKRKALAYERGGFAGLDLFPPKHRPTPIHLRQQHAARTGRPVVVPGLAGALDAWRAPIVYFDFETVQFAVPRFPGTRPWTQVPVQFSVHIDDGSGALRHVAHLADGSDDPRPPLIRALLDACAGTGAIVVYYLPFERDRLRELRASFPAYDAALADVEGRLVDLLDVVQDFVYHPGFRGSFSLKRVLPTLVPELSYEGLAVQDGGVAMAELARLLYGPPLPDAERDRLRGDLLAYCELDTLAMVKLVERLRGMA